ncbi:MAG: hypothetical protein MdMp014T_2846 [Treponematales bacterium]
MPDFLPRREADFSVFATTFTAATVANATALGIPAALVTSLQGKLTAYTAAYNAAEDPNAGKIDREDRDEKREALTADIRKVKNAYIDPDPSGAATAEIRLAFGLPLRDETPTDEPDPTEEVAFSLKHGEYGQIQVIHGARPENYNGAVALYKTVPPGGPVPTVADLLDSRLLTRPHELLQFTEAQIGHTLYITLVWQNTKGRRGPAGPVQNIVIA